jgi:hypothetical protein
LRIKAKQQHGKNVNDMRAKINKKKAIFFCYAWALDTPHTTPEKYRTVPRNLKATYKA